MPATQTKLGGHQRVMRSSTDRILPASSIASFYRPGSNKICIANEIGSLFLSGLGPFENRLAIHLFQFPGHLSDQRIAAIIGGLIIDSEFHLPNGIFDAARVGGIDFQRSVPLRDSQARAASLRSCCSFSRPVMFRLKDIV